MKIASLLLIILLFAASHSKALEAAPPSSPSLPPVSYDPTRECPKVIDVMFDDASRDQVRYVANGKQVCRELWPARPLPGGGIEHPIVSSLQVLVPAERWSAFWQTLQRLDLDHWKPKYVPADPTKVDYSQGAEFWLDLYVFKGHHVRSWGDQAGPVVGHPEQTTLDQDSYNQLKKAFEDLIQPPQA